MKFLICISVQRAGLLIGLSGFNIENLSVLNESRTEVKVKF